MKQIERDKYFVPTILVVVSMIVEEALNVRHRGRFEYVAYLALGAVIILAFYLGFKGKLTKFTRTQATASVTIVIVVAFLIISMIAFLI
jgi:hypothetical protein